MYGWQGLRHFSMRMKRPVDIPIELHGDGGFVIKQSEFEPAYLHAWRTGQLEDRVVRSQEMLRHCTLCPRACGVNRLGGRKGVCRVGARCVVASVFPHSGEEDCLRGWRGSGTIFFSGCNLGCVFCQNYELSHGCEGEEYEPGTLAGAMLALQELGCHNINLVTPTHVVPQILAALAIAIPQGLRIPLVYNCGGYESVETLRLLDGIVDIYMPDFKLWSWDSCRLLLNAEDYAEKACAAIAEMHRQVGVLKVSESGLALRGVLVRHLVMPGLIEDTERILHWLATGLSRDTYLNIMDQYRPAHMVGRDKRFAHIDRRITDAELTRAYEAAKQAGLWRFDRRWL